MNGRCTELVGGDTGNQLCGRPAVEVRLTCPAGRRDATAAYCEGHGGEERARREAEADWCYAAPESVGGEQRVVEAGCYSLCSEHAVVTVQPSNGRWVSGLGTGSHLTIQRGSYATLLEAEAAGIALWRVRVAEAVESIRRARGGTLAWGLPVEPRATPLVWVLVRPGEALDSVRYEQREPTPEALALSLTPPVGDSSRLRRERARGRA